jgi:hypothetical protein
LWRETRRKKKNEEITKLNSCPSNLLLDYFLNQAI